MVLESSLLPCVSDLQPDMVATSWRVEYIVTTRLRGWPPGLGHRVASSRIESRALSRVTPPS